MKRKIKQAAAILIMLITAFAFTLEPSLAKTKTMTAYNEILVSGDIVYCSCDIGIYRVNKKSGKKKLLRRADLDNGGFYAMKKKGKWLYFLAPVPIGDTLYRVNKNTGKGKCLGDYCVEAYSVTKKKVYFKGVKWDDMEKDNYKVRNYKMKRNFKSVKKTSVKVKMKTKRSNKKGYKIITEDQGNYLECWLKTPKKKIYLGKSEYYY